MKITKSEVQSLYAKKSPTSLPTPPLTNGFTFDFSDLDDLTDGFRIRSFLMRECTRYLARCRKILPATGVEEQADLLREYLLGKLRVDASSVSVTYFRGMEQFHVEFSLRRSLTVHQLLISEERIADDMQSPEVQNL